MSLQRLSWRLPEAGVGRPPRAAHLQGRTWRTRIGAFFAGAERLTRARMGI